MPGIRLPQSRRERHLLPSQWICLFFPYQWPGNKGWSSRHNRSQPIRPVRDPEYATNGATSSSRHNVALSRGVPVGKIMGTSRYDRSPQTRTVEGFSATMSDANQTGLLLSVRSADEVAAALAG